MCDLFRIFRHHPDDHIENRRLSKLFERLSDFFFRFRDLLRLRVKAGINPNYLLLALDHSLGQVQFNRWITGSTNGHLAPRAVGRVLVPRLKPDIEARIGELVEESLAKKLESERLLEQAKTRVEQLIEEAVKA